MKKQTLELHPELQDVFRKSPAIHYSKRNLWLVQFLVSLMPASKAPEDVSIKNIRIPTHDGVGTLRLRIYQPQNTSAPTPALVWIHGGGTIMGKPEMDDIQCIQYVRELGISVVSVDYRLAPKHPFPAGLEDCYTALHWAKTHAVDFDIDTSRIGIGGASAGGGLAAALAQLAHDRKEISPVFQLLIYPMLDDRTVLRKEIDDSLSPAWSQRSNRFGWESYLGTRPGADSPPAYAVPARREDLRGLPTAWIGVGTLDVFHDEDITYARRLRESGITCDLDIIPGAFHGFDVFDRELPVVQEFQKMQITALRKHLVQAP
ncbi:MAG TPA: alpha/beta hydrolase [Anaerolineales bacterium]|nr:alpha/beta hydrolase [Anaerolineales bacterium]HNN13463.1 alpha/beta hydrolase [Anaerolineales bacterium]